MMRITPNLIWRLVGAMLVPLLLFTIYLWFSRWPQRVDSGALDWLALVVSSAAGAAMLAGVPGRMVLRITGALAFFLLMGAALFAYAFAFVGLVFDDWL